MSVSVYRVWVVHCDAPGCALQIERSETKHAVRHAAVEAGWYRGAVDLCPAHYREYQRRGLLPREGMSPLQTLLVTEGLAKGIR